MVVEYPLKMKVAVSGKGGTGKTTFSALLGEIYSRKGKRVILVDADPDANLARTLGIEKEIPPLIELKELIRERTGAEPGSSGSFFTLNPRVEDIPDRFFHHRGNILLGVMGSVRGGGKGCTCPENAFLKSLLQHLTFEREDILIMDMEAGVEHLGRGTAQGMDWLLVLVEPGRKSLDTAEKILSLGKDLGIKKLGVVGNKIKDKAEEELLKNSFPSLWLGFLPWREEIISADLKGIPPWEEFPSLLEWGEKIIEKLEVVNEEKESARCHLRAG